METIKLPTPREDALSSAGEADHQPQHYRIVNDAGEDVGDTLVPDEPSRAAIGK